MNHPTVDTRRAERKGGPTARAVARRGAGPVSDPRPRVLLTNGSAYGTLAAARYFGRHGYRVTVADPGPGPTMAQRSRFVHETLRCPARLDFDGMTRWLEDLGRRRPGTLLYPCGDDLAWILASGRDRLAPHFAMLQPAFATIETLLDKQKLYGLCDRLGIPTPDTAYPRDADGLHRIARRLRGRFLFKPKMQVGLSVTRKASLAEAGPALVETYTRFRRDVEYVHHIRRHDPGLSWPMVQRFNPLAARGTISVAGFYAPEGARYHSLTACKALQYPLNIGIGMCFEAVPTPPNLADAVRRICAAAGYFGVFEVEFAPAGDHYELLDFNPRFYGQMQLEISRGLPLPGLVAAAATGSAPDVAVREPPTDGRLVHGSRVQLVMTTQWLAGRLPSNERRRLLRFADVRVAGLCDQVYQADDRRPWAADNLARYIGYCRHPRSGLRTLFGSE